MTTRRDVLSGIGLAAAAAAGASVPALAQSESDYSHWDAQPDHVTLSYSEQTLLQYAPRLDVGQETREKLQGLWGWTATSQEYDLDWHVYVALYSHQEGLSPLGQTLSDSHLGDTEWFYVATDPDTSEVKRVIYDAYHWIAGRRDASSIMVDGQHPVATVVSPWHFYATQNVSTSSAMAFEEIGDLTERFGPLLSNGLAESLEPGTVVDPATMTARDHWWRSSVGEWSFDATLATAVYDLGWVGASSADSL